MSRERVGYSQRVIFAQIYFYAKGHFCNIKNHEEKTTKDKGKSDSKKAEMNKNSSKNNYTRKTKLPIKGKVRGNSVC